MSAAGTHPDLIPFVAGTMASRGMAEIEAHLETCDACRIEAETLRSIRRGLLAEEELRHLSCEDLVSYDEDAGDLEPGARAAIGDHLHRCRSCRADLEALSRARAARERRASAPRPVAPSTPAVPMARRARRAWSAAAAAVLLLGLGIVALQWARLDGGALRSTPIALTLMPPTRGGAEVRHLVAGTHASIRVGLPYGAPGGAYRARIERDDGVVVARPGTVILSDGELLSVDAEVPSVPGAYRLVLSSERDPGAGPQVIPFRVVAAAPVRGDR